MSILFLDIETAPEYPTFNELPDDGKAAFKKKFQAKVDSEEYPNLESVYQNEAALYAEFSKIICLGIGSVVIDKNSPTAKEEKIYLKGLTGTETEILDALLVILEKTSPDKICAHRGKTFDFPFIGRRLQINKYALPPILNVAGKKPWEVPWEDTAELWSFTDRRHYVSLITLAYVFKIPSPKQQLDGSQVPAAYQAGRIAEIKIYCLEDVLCLIRIWRCLKSLPEIKGVIKA